MKKCTACSEVFPETLEYFSDRGKAGLRAQCRACYLTANRRRIAADPSKQAASAHRCYVRKKAEYRVVNKAWVANNIDKVRANHRRANRRTLATAKGILRNRVGSYIRQALRRRGVDGYLPVGVMRWLPYSMDDLAAHLGAQFVDGMGWHNVSEWHVDHIRPVSSFDFTLPTDSSFLECWALSNLQPLWAVDNQRKGAKWGA